MSSMIFTLTALNLNLIFIVDCFTIKLEHYSLNHFTNLLNKYGSSIQSVNKLKNSNYMFLRNKTKI